MKTMLASFGWLLLLLPLLSLAGTKSILKYTEGTEPGKETRQVSGFHSVSSAGSFDVFIEMGSTESLRLEGDPEQLANVETHVENGVLKIYPKARSLFNQGLFKSVKVYISAKSLDGLSLSGSGNLAVNGAIKAAKLSAKVSGSGKISFTANVSDFSATVSGSGKINASGSSDRTDIKISGSGQFSGKNFRTDDGQIKVSGSGDVYIAAEKSLDAMVSGSGSIYYSGNPSIKVSKSGSGKVSKI